MFRRWLTSRTPLALSVLLIMCTYAPAAPMLLVEMFHDDFKALTSGQPEMHFTFEVNGIGDWTVVATTADIGRTFSTPNENLSYYNEVLTKPDLVSVSLTCCEGSKHTFLSPPRLNTGNTTGDQILVTRVAPNLGPNLVGYRLTDVTQTIDDITIALVPGSGGRYNRSGAHTVRIYGEVIPEPTTWVLAAAALVGLHSWIRRPCRELRPVAFQI